VVPLILALVYEWRKTLLTPILLHAVVNAVGMIFLAATLAADAAAPRLGVFGKPSQGGCVVREVVPASPAEAAGLQVGDVITTVDGQPVADMPGISRIIRTHQLGETVSVEYLREGKPHRADVVLMRLKQ
jgi:S1-C subfamily serine protease